MTLLNLHASRSWKNAAASFHQGSAREEPTPARARESPDNARNAEAWHSVLAVLRAWEREPMQREDEGVEAPSFGTIRKAIGLAQLSQARGVIPPDDITSDAEGGIVMRRHQDDLSEEYHISEDGIEYRCFVGTRLDERIRYGNEQSWQ